MKNNFVKLTAALILTSVMILSTAACSGTTTNTIPAAKPANTTSATATELKPDGTTTTAATSAATTATTSAATTATTKTNPAETTTTAPSSTAEPTATAVTAVTQKTFTLAELAQYNGQNGNPSYVAVNGIVYDVSALQQWKNGAHQGYQAGVDLTKDFQSAPHGTDVLLQAKEVGILIP